MSEKVTSSCMVCGQGQGLRRIYIDRQGYTLLAHDRCAVGYEFSHIWVPRRHQPLRGGQNYPAPR